MGVETKQERKRGKGTDKGSNKLRQGSLREEEMRAHSGQAAMGLYDTLANQSAVILSHKLSYWPSSHQDLVLLPLSLTDSPVQLFKVYKQEPSIQQAAEPVK